MISTTSNDVIVLDVEKYPQVGWGIRVGTYLGLESYHLADEYFKYIPQHITYLRYPVKMVSWEISIGERLDSRDLPMV